MLLVRGRTLEEFGRRIAFIMTLAKDLPSSHDSVFHYTISQLHKEIMAIHISLVELLSAVPPFLMASGCLHGTFPSLFDASYLGRRAVRKV